MGNATDVVNRFFKAIQAPDGREEVARLLADDFTFTGPVVQTRGAAAYLRMMADMGCALDGFRFHSQVVSGDQVVSFYDMTLRTPSGEPLTLAIADHVRVRGGRLAEQQIYYDPRAFLAAFGNPAPAA